MILYEIRRPNSLKIVPTGVANCRNLPFGERATWGSRVRLPWEENAWSRHQRLFEENIGKNRKRCGLWPLSVTGSGVVFTHGEGISTPRVRHMGRHPLIKCANMTSKCFIFPFMSFCVFMHFMLFVFFFSSLFFIIIVILYVFFFLFFLNTFLFSLKSLF